MRHQRPDGGRRDAEVGYSVPLDHRPHAVRLGIIGGAVIHEEGRAEHERAAERPGFHGTSLPSRRCTITFSTLGDASAAWSATSFMAIGLPRRVNPSAVTSTFAPQSFSRDATLGAA